MAISQHEGADVGIARRRLELGLTQAQLATLAGCSRASVNLLEGGYAPKQSVVMQRIESTLADIEAGMAIAASINHDGGAAASDTPVDKSEETAHAIAEQ